MQSEKSEGSLGGRGDLEFFWGIEWELEREVLLRAIASLVMEFSDLGDTSNLVDRRGTALNKAMMRTRRAQ